MRERLKINANTGAFAAWVAICFFSVGNFNPEIIPIEAAGLTSNQLLLLALLCILSYRSIIEGSARLVLRGTMFPLFLLSLFATASFAWSLTPLQSFVKGMTFLLLLAATCHLSKRVPPEKMLKGLLIGTVGTLLLSYVAIVVFPEIAARGVVFRSMNTWRGIFSQKNVLGRACLLVFCVCLIFIYRKHRLRAVYLLPLLPASHLLFASESATAMVSIGLFGILYFIFIGFLRSGKTARGLSISMLLVLIAVSVFIIPYALDFAIDATGKDLTLTGRTQLWALTIDQIYQAPVGGYGLDAFFGRAEMDDFFKGTLTWIPEHAHNGLLDITIELGLIGLTLFIWSAWRVLSGLMSIRQLRPDVTSLGAFTISLLLLLNITESNLFRPSNLIWILFIASAAHITRARVDIWQYRAQVPHGVPTPA